MLNKIKKWPWQYYIRELRDVRVLGLIVFCVIVLLTAWSGLGVIQTNYKLQQQLNRLNEQNKVQELENQNFKLRNQYLETDTYLELIARKQFGKAAAGETLVLVPKDVALSHSTEPLVEKKLDAGTAQPTKPTYQKNFEAWLEFFFHRYQ